MVTYIPNIPSLSYPNPHAGAGYFVFKKLYTKRSQIKHTIGPAKISRGGGGRGVGGCALPCQLHTDAREKMMRKGTFFQTGQCAVLVPT